MSTHNKGFYEDLTKIIFEISSNTHLISSAVTVVILSVIREQLWWVIQKKRHGAYLMIFDNN